VGEGANQVVVWREASARGIRQMELVTERLILREFIESDWPAVLAYQSDPRYLRYYEWTERTPEAARAFVQMFVAHQREQPRTKFQLAVTLKSDGQLIGNCGIRMASIDAHEGDIGYELAPCHWGRGYATEAARAMVRFGFTGLGLHRIWAECNADNTASAHVLEKLGMRCEGRLRDKAYYKGRWWDTLLYAVLDYEWHEHQGE
jgi:ribosomal-protein-alanine N-acetyltransferase